MIGVFASRFLLNNSNSIDRANTRWKLTLVGLALAEYRAEHGLYPKSLSELKPDYLAEIPDDLFDGNPLRYRTASQQKEMLLYSVGENETDEDGLMYGESSKAHTDPDDLRIRTEGFPTLSP